MRVLFVHQNCPGQFKHLAPRLAALPGNEVVFITRPGKPDLPGVRKVEYSPSREPAASTHRYLRLTEEGVLSGQAVARVALTVKKQGFTPDVIVAHMGWGEALYLKDVWPRAALLGYFEYYYHALGADADFAREEPMTLDDVCRIRTRNALHLLNLDAADWGITPTRWQWQQHPAELRPKISVVHDGVDVARAVPDPQAFAELRSGLTLRAGDEVITYVARNLEPYRGFPTFMRAAEMILKRRPKAHILVVGGDGVSYGSRPKDGGNWREHMLREVDLDPNRIRFIGRVPYDRFLRVLQVSAAHVYLTVPFVLSWSMLEAMAAGCLVIGSRTPPVEEVIEDGKNGLLVDFFSASDLATRVDEVLDHPDRMRAVREAARDTVRQRYALDVCLPQQQGLVETLAQGRRPLVEPVDGQRVPPRKASVSPTSRPRGPQRRAGRAR